MDTFGIENVNFTVINEESKRWDEFKQQRLERGFDDSELWNLDRTIAKFILPRLNAFASKTIGTPPTLTTEEWKSILQKMINAFEIIADDDRYFNYAPSTTDDNIIEEGLDLFNKWFCHLWY
jgi:hypothetical protein